MFTGLQRDIRHAMRAIFRDPSLTAAVVITLALAIGPTSAIFTAVDAVLLRSAPVADPDRVVSVYTAWAARGTANPKGGGQLGLSSYPDYADLRDSGALKGLAAFAGTSMTLDMNGVSGRIDAAIVSGNYFEVIGVHPIAGRAFTPDEDRIGSPIRVAVISHRMWHERFGGNSGIVGRSVTLNGSPYTVIGIAPRGFTGVDMSERPEIWVPIALQAEVRPANAGFFRRGLGSSPTLGNREVRWLDMAGLLKDDSSLVQTSETLNVIGRRLAAAYPKSNSGRSVTAVRLGDGLGTRTKALPVLRLVAAVVTLVLMIACANVASLLLARAVSRRREVAVRMALGAGGLQLVRQWLTETVILGILGAAGGLILGAVSTPIFYQLGIPEGVDLTMNARVLAFTLIVGVTTGIIFGLAPVIQLVRRDTITALRDEGGSVAGGASATRLRNAFVVLQVALSFVLIVGAGLLVRTLQHAYAVNLGYSVDRMVLAEISPGEKYSAESGQVLYEQLLERLNTVPGVLSASAARVAVLSGASRTFPVSIDGKPVLPDRSNAIPARVNIVTERYLETMGIPLIRGRNFQKSDTPGSAPVAIVSRSLAERLWFNADPIGQTLFSTSRIEVVGVVPDTVYVNPLERDPRPFFYLPLAQNYEAGVTLHVRTRGDPAAIVPAVRQAVRDVDPRLALTRVRGLADEFERSILDQRTMATLVGTLGSIALLLAAVGLYSVMAYVTQQRTSEVGLRMALGATPASVMMLIVARGTCLVMIGTFLGCAGAFAGVRYIQSRLFGVEPTDPFIWLAACALLALAGLGACALPARHAMRIDPAVALRNS